MKPTRTGLLFTVDVTTWTQAQIRLLQQAVADIDAARDVSDRVVAGRVVPGGVVPGRTAPPAVDLAWAPANVQVSSNDGSDDATMGWPSRDALLELITRLQAGGYDTQAWAVRTCLDGGGSIRRSQILQRLGKDADATLRGWTRPLNRIVDEMRTAGSVGRSAALPLAPQFAGDDGRADYFVAPEPLVRLWFQMGQT